tara:strand:- start:349 stop:1392 length:1044 start_codon:yes stop_codon:yes gene_type:complete
MAYTNIDDPSAHFQTLAYTGNADTPSQTFTNTGNSNLKPDLLWVKNRTGWGARNHLLWDSSRGVNKYLRSNTTNAELTSSYQTFNTDGFTVPEGFETAYIGPYVAWQWKANGGTTASNSDGNITSTVQANTTAGFSIVTWTGNENSSASVGHGLGVTPDLVMFKNRSSAYNWVIYLGALGQTSGNNMFAYLNLTNAAEQGAGITFTSSLLNPGSGATTNASSMLAYCFNNVQGYSKFGSYEGNSNANGPFIYTGFKPAFVMLKPADVAEQWVMHDGARDPGNKAYHYLFANGSEAEASGGTHGIDLLSNGFKIRTNNANWNASSTVIYMAFAENPFVTSTGIPTTAR